MIRKFRFSQPGIRIAQGSLVGSDLFLVCRDMPRLWGANREFIAARKSTEAILDGIDSDELRYFRENMLDAFSRSLDEL